ncbi:hypothetical protein QFC21_004794 [Naganishia friedmannii]|uniref:Uncharacterized protein n=1 Tax=Naganishia friedmannii TaxID=89922 RepID=A0ACC2VFY4_9TREE|nr:hypothetical protein QFC21_004794 [Naganishia friedmannii]
MVKLTLYIKMELENATEVQPSSNFQYCMNESSMSQEEREMSGSRGSANFVFRCQDCKRESSASFASPTSSSKDQVMPYTSQTAQWQPLISLDCRGLEPTNFLVTNGQGGEWKCQAFSQDEGAKTKPAEFSFELDEDGRWDDYDEVNAREIGVREIESKWEKS